MILCFTTVYNISTIQQYNKLANIKQLGFFFNWICSKFFFLDECFLKSNLTLKETTIFTNY